MMIDVRGAQDAISAEVAPILALTAKTSVGHTRAPSRPLLDLTEWHGYALCYGNAHTPMRWSGMWRMIWPDGQLSDTANLSRIRDAAAAFCERGPPARNRRRFRWKVFRAEVPGRAVANAGATG
jgi:hypothetical protein